MGKWDSSGDIGGSPRPSESFLRQEKADDQAKLGGNVGEPNEEGRAFFVRGNVFPGHEDGIGQKEQQSADHVQDQRAAGQRINADRHGRVYADDEQIARGGGEKGKRSLGSGPNIKQVSMNGNEQSKDQERDPEIRQQRFRVQSGYPDQRSQLGDRRRAAGGRGSSAERGPGPEQPGYHFQGRYQLPVQPERI